MDLLPSEHGRKGVVIFGADMREESPISMREEADEKHLGGGEGLADRLGPPALLELYKEEIVTQLSFGERGGVAAKVLVDKPELAIVGMPGSVGVVAQSQVVGKRGHGGVRMLIVNRVGIVSRGGPNGCQRLVRPQLRVGGVIIGFVI